MDNLFSKALCMFFVTVFVLTGCRQDSRNSVNNLASEPDYTSVSIPSGSEAQAIEAVGGLEAWTDLKNINLDCVVAFYHTDDSFYLSGQKYEIYPWSDSIRISGVEPQGKYTWQYSNERFKVLEGGERFGNQPDVLESRSLAELILTIITVPARLMDASFDFNRQTTSVNIQGQWYNPIYRKKRNAGEEFNSIFYQNRKNSLIDSIWFPRNGDVSLIVRGYDYRKEAGGNIYIPSKIEIFATDKQGNMQQRLVRIECGMSNK